MRFNRIAVIFAALAILLIAANESCGQTLGKLAIAIEKLNLPSDLAELKQCDPSMRPWGFITDIRKPEACKLPGNFVIIGTFPMEESEAKQYNLLLYYTEEETTVLAIFILYKDERPAKPYWFGDGKDAEAIDREVFKKKMNDFIGVTPQEGR